MKSFKQLMEDIREARQKKTTSPNRSSNQSRGEAFEIGLAAHISSENNPPAPEHYPQTFSGNETRTKYGNFRKSNPEEGGQIHGAAKKAAQKMREFLISRGHGQFIKNHKIIHTPNPYDVKRAAADDTVDSRADLVMRSQNPKNKKKIGLSVKLGDGTTRRTMTINEITGLLKRGHPEYKKEHEGQKINLLRDRVNSLYSSARRKISSGKIAEGVSRVTSYLTRRKIAKLHADAFNGIKDQNKRKEILRRMTDSVRNPTMPNYRVQSHRSGKISITEPAADMDKALEGIKSIHAAHDGGVGFHVYGVTHSGEIRPLYRVSHKTNRGSDSRLDINVKPSEKITKSITRHHKSLSKR